MKRKYAISRILSKGKKNNKKSQQNRKYFLVGGANLERQYSAARTLLTKDYFIRINFRVVDLLRKFVSLKQLNTLDRKI